VTEAGLTVDVAAQFAGRPTGMRAFLPGLRRFLVQKKLGTVGLVIVAFFVLVAVFAPVFSRYDPDFIFDRENPNFKTDPSIAELAADPNIGSPRTVDKFADPGAKHWFGTDNPGRDIYARVIYGSRLSLIVGLAASLLAVGAGLVLGTLSGFYRGWLDLGLQRLIDALQAFPAIVLLLVLVQVAEPSVRNTVLAMGAIGIPITTRLVRSAVFTVVQADYVSAARAIGATDTRIMIQHVLPNIASVLLITFSIGIGAYILFEATISFLGVGPRGVVSWGKMVNEGRGDIDLHPWLAVFSGGALTLLVAGFNFLGDALRDVLDPRLRGSH
jgi:peptide/nickel transport system permease protein